MESGHIERFEILTKSSKLNPVLDEVPPNRYRSAALKTERLIQNFQTRTALELELVVTKKRALFSFLKQNV